MIVDAEIKLAYDCNYKILIATKFKKNVFTNVKFFGNLIKKINADQKLLMFDIKLNAFSLEFNISVAPNRKITATIYKLINVISKDIISTHNNLTFPIFSRSFMCSTIETSPDKKEYLNAIKPSYRSTLGELL